MVNTYQNGSIQPCKLFFSGCILDVHPKTWENLRTIWRRCAFSRVVQPPTTIVAYHTVDGLEIWPWPVDMLVNIPVLIGFHTCWVDAPPKKKQANKCRKNHFHPRRCPLSYMSTRCWNQKNSGIHGGIYNWWRGPCSWFKIRVPYWSPKASSHIVG